MTMDNTEVMYDFGLNDAVVVDEHINDDYQLDAGFEPIIGGEYLVEQSFDINNHFWQLEDGRVWSTAKAAFVPEQEAHDAGFDEIPASPVDKNQQHTLEGLREALLFYKLPLGELKYQAIPLDEAKSLKLEELTDAWLAAEAHGVVKSSLGFDIDATERANRDINGLITGMTATKTEKTLFCGADNSFHEVTVADLSVMLLEIIGYAQSLYAKKWELRSEIERATTLDEIRAIDIKF